MSFLVDSRGWMGLSLLVWATLVLEFHFASSLHLKGLSRVIAAANVPGL